MPSLRLPFFGLLTALVASVPTACAASCATKNAPAQAREAPQPTLPQPDAPDATDATDGARSDLVVDEFGVEEMYATTNNGREWFLPVDADRKSDEWDDKDAMARTSEPGVFKVIGALQPRLDVRSPAGKAWWRNVEITGYIRMTGLVEAGTSQRPHWTFYARGERHTHELLEAVNRIDNGVRAPPGTETWPGYPFGDASSVNARCLGTSIKGLFYPEGEAEWKKELSHPDGYTGGRPSVFLDWKPEVGAWFGMKVAIRNYGHDTGVKMEMWLDEKADGQWKMVAEGDDPGSGWYAKEPQINSCDQPPFNYKTDEAITWAGPFAVFRVDNIDYDMKWASVREVAPLP